MEKDRAKVLKRSSIIVLLIFLIIGTIQVFTNSSGTITCNLDASQSLLGVIGAYGDATFIHLEDIEDITLTDSVDFGTLVEGKETGKLYSGTYKNSEYGSYALHVYFKVASFITIHYDDGKVIVFNQSSVSNTKTVYDNIIKNMP